MLDQVCPMQYLAKWKKFGSEYSTSVLRYHRADDSFHTCPHCPTSLYARSQKHGGSFFTAAAASVSEIQVDPSVLDAYQGYSAMNIQTWHDGDKGRFGSYLKLCDFTLLSMTLQVELRLNKRIISETQTS